MGASFIPFLFFFSFIFDFIFRLSLRERKRKQEKNRQTDTARALKRQSFMEKSRATIWGGRTCHLLKTLTLTSRLTPQIMTASFPRSSSTPGVVTPKVLLRFGSSPKQPTCCCPPAWTAKSRCLSPFFHFLFFSRNNFIQIIMIMKRNAALGCV